MYSICDTSSKVRRVSPVLRDKGGWMNRRWHGTCPVISSVIPSGKRIMRIIKHRPANTHLRLSGSQLFPGSFRLLQIQLEYLECPTIWNIFRIRWGCRRESVRYFILVFPPERTPVCEYVGPSRILSSDKISPEMPNSALFALPQNFCSSVWRFVRPLSCR